MGSASLVGLYIDIKEGAGIAGTEILRVLRTADDRIIVECAGGGDFCMVAAMIEGTEQNIDLLRQIADAMRSRMAA